MLTFVHFDLMLAKLQDNPYQNFGYFGPPFAKHRWKRGKIFLVIGILKGSFIAYVCLNLSSICHQGFMEALRRLYENLMDLSLPLT